MEWPPGRSLFSAIHNDIFAGGESSFMRPGPVNATPVHEVFSTIDSVFLCRLYEEARGLAMRELGLDGYTPVADEVRVSFRERATGILDAAEQNQVVNNNAFLDLVKLCLCVEILRHLRAPTPGSAAALRGPIVNTGISQHGGPALSSSSMMWPRTRGRREDGLQSGPSVDLVFVMGGPRVEDGTGMVVIGLSDTIAGFDGPFRADSSFLHGRVASLLTALLGAGVEGRMAGRPPLTEDEINQHCPLGARAATDDGCCPICLEAGITGELVRTFPCGHCFHQECCQAWLANADTCPTCRFQVPRGT